VPRLKPFGEAFAARGFKLDPAQEPPRATIDTGDPELHLMRELPLALRLDGFASWKEGSLAETDVQWPWAFKVLSGGPISDLVSYYVYFIAEKGGVRGLEDAYLQFKTVSWRLAGQVGPARIGVFSYFGKQRELTGIRNRTWYAGPDIVVDFSDSLQLNAQHLERRDDDPFFSGD
jgi:hypothetical protein